MGEGKNKVINRQLSSKHLSQKQMNNLHTLIYYPEEKMTLLLNELSSQEEKNQWYKETLTLLIELCVFAASKYTRSKVRKALPKEFAYILEELLTRSEERRVGHEWFATCSWRPGE